MAMEAELKFLLTQSTLPAFGLYVAAVGCGSAKT